MLKYPAWVKSLPKINKYGFMQNIMHWLRAISKHFKKLTNMVQGNLSTMHTEKIIDQ